ncbi:MAG: GNAT family N-acetyltransferase [Pseudomonadota bacterium]
MTELTIRPLEDADRPGWQDLWAQYNAFYGREGKTALAPEIVDEAWARLLSDAEPVHGLVAVRDGALMGLVHIVFHRNLLRVPDTCYLQDLFTVSAVRGEGIGRRLIEAVGERCRAHGVGDIYWHTHSGNDVARALYDRVATNTEFLVYRLKLD